MISQFISKVDYNKSLLMFASKVMNGSSFSGLCSARGHVGEQVWQITDGDMGVFYEKYDMLRNMS